MSRFWSTVVKGLTPYVPGEQPKLANLVKLNTNENPYGPSPKVLEALRGEDRRRLRLYPDPNADRLKAAVASFFGDIEPRNVFVGNGSDEVLAHVFLALLKHERPILFPDITYSFYPVYCGLYGVPYETVPLDECLRHPRRRLRETQRRHHLPQPQRPDRPRPAAGRHRPPARRQSAIRWW